MLAGAILTETVFNWPGIGYAIYRGDRRADYPVVFGCTIIILFAVMVDQPARRHQLRLPGSADPRSAAESTGGVMLSMTDRGYSSASIAERDHVSFRTPAHESPVMHVRAASPHAVGRRLVPTAAATSSRSAALDLAAHSHRWRQSRRTSGCRALRAAQRRSTRRPQRPNVCSLRRSSTRWAPTTSGRDIFVARHLRRPRLADGRCRPPFSSRC